MWNWIDKINELRGSTFAIATIAKTAGSSPRKIGAKMVITSSDDFFGTIGGGIVEKEVIEQAKICIKTNESGSYNFDLAEKAGQVCGGKVDVLIEVVGSTSKLYIFGAGHIGQAICKMLDGTPFQAILVDTRKEWLTKPELPKSVITFNGTVDEIAPQMNNNDYAVVLTHDHAIDFEVVSVLIKQPLRYRGLIGSKNKWNNFSKRLKELGLSDDQIAGIKSPIGLINAGNAPQEIAISLVAELLALHYEK